jgi:hypothetical protein
VRVALVTRPSWSGWSEGIGALRTSVLAGALELVELPDLDAADGGIEPENVRSLGAIYFAAGLDHPSFGQTALEAAGWRVRRVESPAEFSPDSARLVVVASPVVGQMESVLRSAAEAGATVLVAAPAAPSLRGLVPWTGTTVTDSAGGGMWLATGLHVSGAALRVSGAAARGAKVVAAWDDGRPAAAARRIGRGCVVFAATDLERGEMTLDPGYPRLLDGLARGCEPADRTVPRDAPLDAGARAVLRGSGPSVVAARTVPGWGGGVPLGRWLLAAALLTALAETFLAYGRKRAA